MSAEAQAPPPRYVENGPESTDLLDEIDRRIRGAQERVWVKVAWWDATSDAGRRLGAALVDARERGVDVRVVMRNDASGLPTIARLRQVGIEVRPSRYIHEKEVIADRTCISHSMNFTRAETERNTQAGYVHVDEGTVAAAADRFQDMWVQLAALDRQRGEEKTTPAKALVPQGWLPLLAHATMNPFQSDIVPAVLSATGHVIVVAPTGAGKTVVGELALLRAVTQDKRKGVWLVPARALASELGALRKRWQPHGISVEVLTGEMNLSSERLRKADVWLSTTEKFESLCRRTSLQDAVADVSCIVVDEIHLIGDPSRGATLEALLARLRLLSDSTRVVGLSATASNAGELASWLGAQLLASTWRPTVLITQVLEYHPRESSWAGIELAKDEIVRTLVSDARRQGEPPSGDSSDRGDGDAGVSVLVFVGSKKTARHVAAMLANVPGDGPEDQVVKRCLEQGVGVHYRGAPGAEDTRRMFNARQIPVLVATSGLSTGVNTPARVVIVRDLLLGKTPIEVSQLQQMFGRAGRAGHESDGYAYVLVPAGEAAIWQQRLAVGYRVDSKLAGREVDAALAEIHLGNISTADELAAWYETTYAAAQSTDRISAASILEQLSTAGMVTTSAEGSVSISAAGRLTVQLMIDVQSTVNIRHALGSAIPSSAQEAERWVVQAVCGGTTPLATRQINPKDWEAAVHAALSSRGIPEEWGEFGARFSAATCLEALDEGGTVRDLAKRDVLEEAPRYFTWLAELGRLGLATWASIVAEDIAERLMSYRLQDPRPTRGSGRVLKFLRSLVEPEEADGFVLNRWRPASTIVTPDGFPARSTDPRVRAEALLRARQGALRAGIPQIEQQGPAITVKPGVQGAVERVVMWANSGLGEVTGEAGAGVPLTIPLPDGAGRAGEVVVEVIAFSRTDAVYAAAHAQVDAVADSVTAQDARMAKAQVALSEARDLGVVHGERARRSMFRKKREEAEREHLLSLADNSGLQGVGRALVEDLGQIAALWSIREAVEAWCPLAATHAAARPLVTVLKSGRATLQERALVRYALVKGSGLPARLVQGDDVQQLHCVAQVAGENMLLETSMPAGRLSWLGGGGQARLTTLQDKPEEPPLTAQARMGWLTDFMENQTTR